ncbi:hypothetical protein [Sulfobacillus thermosulfidooxidans]|uniref:hypothetical protein n=1 Tax=Sulfobacillus thermosulfidooxidans TaxID=28034 RepID=UPI0002FAEF8B|nr:hypothetical protein [Sulfobacillus thermosulfidooxidans]
MSKPDAVVVTGGLGYVGQSLAAVLKERGQIPIVVDYRDIPSQVPGVPVFMDPLEIKKSGNRFMTSITSMLCTIAPGSLSYRNPSKNRHGIFKKILWLLWRC